MRIGAHVSSAGGVDKVVDRALEIGAEAVQIFVSPPQSFAFKPLEEKPATDFKLQATEHGVGPNALHAIYLLSLANPDESMVRRGIQSLVSYMHAAHDLDMLGVIFHLGSHKGVGFDGVYRPLIESLNRVLDNSPEDTHLILENSAGMGNHVGSKFSELGAILKGLADPRVKVCLDTQHSFAAGYDLTSPEGVAKVMEEFDREIGLQELVAVHCNDSKPPFCGAVDRHENIGEGQMGLAAFEAVVGHPAFRNVPFYLEVPGYEKKGPDKPNVDTIKAIREKQAIPA